MSEEQKQQYPSVELFEKWVAKKNYEGACNELLRILEELDRNFGSLGNIQFSGPIQLNEPNMEYERIKYFCTRVAVGITTLFSDKALSISEQGAQRFFGLQRWLNMIFATSPYVNADHILQSYNLNADKGDNLEVLLDGKIETLVKFCILYLQESNVHLNLDALWQLNPNLCASLCFSLQSARFIGTPSAFSKRAAILQWFPDKLEQINDLVNLPSIITHDVYMHCSYDSAPNKHSVKNALNKVIRRHILSDYKWQDRNVNKIGYRDGKPVIVVVLEHFHSSHSIYRTHSTSMRAAREHFHLIGLGNDTVDALGQAVFDEFHLIKGDNLKEKMELVKAICEENGAAILYMPSIGMDVLPIFLSNARLAPIQAIALGHPATTHSKFIEYVVVEDDYVGSEGCFSEKLLRLPKDALPYVPSALAPKSVNYKLRENPEVVQIGIASTTMKLNPVFLKALKDIRDQAKVKVHFHFVMGQSSGVTHPYVARFIQSYLGDDATAHAHRPYDEYLAILNDCDMLVNPFPFGNTNGIIDMVTLGLVGICKTGPEVHEHIDEGLFKRLGLPEWLIANTVEEYVERAIRLAENHEERLALRRQIIENNGLQTLFSGDPSPMGRVFLEKLREWADSKNIELEVASTLPQTSAPKENAEKPKKAEKAPKATKAKATKAKSTAKTAEKKTATKKATAKKKD